MKSPPKEHAIYTHTFKVSEKDLDGNGHVNNVVYVQWMQDVAIKHFHSSGGSKAIDGMNATWVARSHTIEYLKPAKEGDKVIANTWVTNFRRVRSTRRYRFLRDSDGAILAEGKTDWVFVDEESGKPRRIPEEIIEILPPHNTEPPA